MTTKNKRAKIIIKRYSANRWQCQTIGKSGKFINVCARKHHTFCIHEKNDSVVLRGNRIAGISIFSDGETWIYVTGENV